MDSEGVTFVDAETFMRVDAKESIQWKGLIDRLTKVDCPAQNYSG